MKHVSEYLGDAVSEIVNRSDNRKEIWDFLVKHIPLAAEHMKQGKALGMTFEKPRVRMKP